MKKKKLMRRVWAAKLSLAAVLMLLLWTEAAEKKAHISPGYPREDISRFTNQAGEDQASLTEEDYDLLFRQTGLGPSGVKALWEAGLQTELPILQERFFSEVEVECSPNTIVSRAERLTGEEGKGQVIPVVEDGDILINFNCHFFGWRSGHAGIVTDAERRITLEARVPGTDTAFLRLDNWEEYPSFAVLRLKDVSSEERSRIADYAGENLTGVPYRLTAGLWDGQDKEEYSAAGNLFEADQPAAELSGTQCAHLVWYAYSLFGYDLDSDGGKIVTPRDIYESPLLEVVQIYGMEAP